LYACLQGADPASAAPTVIDLPAGTLRQSLDRLTLQARISVALPGRMPSLRTPRVSGRMEAGDALARLLEGSGWEARQVGPNTWKLVPTRKSRPASGGEGQAQTAPSPPVDIVVTALKREQQLLTVPAAISVMDGTRFGSASVARGSSDLAEEVVSVFSTNLGPGRERLFLRGVADSPFNGPTQSTVGLFLDDSRINFALPDPDLRLVDVDHVEVLRGPQGTLYGTGALGGIVRIITNRPQLDQWGGGVALEGSSVSHGDTGGALEGFINAPLAEGSLALRAAAYIDSTGGWIDDTLRDRSNINRATRIGARVNLRWMPSPDWTVDISVVAQDLKARDTQYATSGMTRANAIAEPQRNQFFLARIEARGPIGALDFLSSTAIENNQIDSRFDASSVATQQGLPAPLAYDEQRRIYLISQEFRLSNPRDRHRWVVGVSIIDAINVLEGNFVPLSSVAKQARLQGNLTLEAAAFGEATLQLAEALDLTIGLRAFTAQIADDPRDIEGPGTRRDGFTPSATLSWHPGNNVLLWARYASAIRPGGRNRTGVDTAVTFKSDDLKSLELGNRLTLLDGHLVLSTAIFGLKWRNLQSDRINLDGLVTTANIDDAINYGVETDARAQWHDLSLEASLTRQHGRLASREPTTGKRPRLPVLPDLSARARLSWDRSFGPWTAGTYVAANYWGSAQLGFDPAFPQRIPARLLVSVGASIARDGWRASLSISNLLDSRKDSFAFGNPFSFRTTPQYTPLQPRTFGVRFERSF
jgi:outer membrane receptor protein involved in Fe transport